MTVRHEMRGRVLRSTVMAMAMALAGFGGLAAAAEEDHARHQAMDHSQHQAMDHSQHAAMDHSLHGGDGAADPHAAHRAAMAKPTAASTLDVAVPNAQLLDQEGKPVRFVEDVLGDKVVIVDFVYTTCTTICPVQSALFNALQSKLADKLGRSVELVSVSVDPRRDTPARLKQAAEKYGSGANWHWLTGERAEVEDVLRAYGAYTPNYTEHPPLVLVGDAVQGKWTRFFGFPDMQKILDAVDTTLAARNSSTYAKAQ